MKYEGTDSLISQAIEEQYCNMITSTDDKISARVSAIMQDYKNNLFEELKLDHPIIYIDGKEVDTNIYIFLLKQILKQNDFTDQNIKDITQEWLKDYEEEILNLIGDDFSIDNIFEKRHNYNGRLLEKSPGLYIYGLENLLEIIIEKTGIKNYYLMLDDVENMDLLSHKMISNLICKRGSFGNTREGKFYIKINNQNKSRKSYSSFAKAPIESPHDYHDIKL